MQRRHFRLTGQQIISAAETSTMHPSSKIAKENLDVFHEAWESQSSDMSTLLREISDVFEGKRGEKYSSLSFPKPVKNSTNLRSLKPDKSDSEEQDQIAKLGLKLGLLTSARRAMPTLRLRSGRIRRMRLFNIDGTCPVWHILCVYLLGATKNLPRFNASTRGFC